MAVITRGQQLQSGKLVNRENRFVAQVRLDNDQLITAYVPNPGRMEELMIPGSKVLVGHYPSKSRKTEYDLLVVEYNDTLVSIDTRIPNQIVELALNNKEIPEFKNYSKIKPEYTYGNSRLDFLLENKQEKCLIEVKSVTLVENKVAKFPDAPTKRGRRHLEELIAAKKQGYRTAVIFIIQRNDAREFIPHDRIDLKFAEKLRKAKNSGVEIYAYDCQITEQKIRFNIPVNVNVG